MATFATVQRVARTIPGVEEGTAWGVPALKLHGRFLACMARHRSAEPNTLVVRMPFEQRDAMIADDPKTYYLKPHYESYQSVLVRLSRVDVAALRDLLQAASRYLKAEALTRRVSRGGTRARSGAPRPRR